MQKLKLQVLKQVRIIKRSITAKEGDKIFYYD